MKRFRLNHDAGYCKTSIEGVIMYLVQTKKYGLKYIIYEDILPALLSDPYYVALVVVESRYGDTVSARGASIRRLRECFYTIRSRIFY